MYFIPAIFCLENICIFDKINVYCLLVTNYGGNMSKIKNQKLKLFYLAKLFYEKSDDNHKFTLNEIKKYLAENDITVTDPTLYNDIECLKMSGIDINSERKGSTTVYYLAGRMFDLAELKLLSDVIYSSRFITGSKTKDLVDRLKKLTSTYNAEQLDSNIVVPDRIKSHNRSVFYNVDYIQKAISNDVKIVFKYFSWLPDFTKSYHHDNSFIKVSPFAVCYDNDKYYMIAYDGEKIKHYRIDKMENVDFVDEESEGYEEFEKENLDNYTSKHFGMFGGTLKTVKLKCKRYMANVIIDQFGNDIDITECDQEPDYFFVEVEVNVSNQFFGWIAGLGGDVRIIAPEEVRVEFVGLMRRLM